MWLVVVRLERPLLDLVLAAVRLRRRLDVDEGDGGTHAVAQHAAAASVAEPVVAVK